MLNLNSIMIGTSNPQKLALFYQKVFDRKPDMIDGDWYGFSVGSCFLSIGAHDQVKGKAKNPERLIINFETEQVKKDFDRIKVLGATVIKAPYNASGDDKHEILVATLADPDGNYFQLMEPWESGN